MWFDFSWRPAWRRIYVTLCVYFSVCVLDLGTAGRCYVCSARHTSRRLDLRTLCVYLLICYLIVGLFVHLPLLDWFLMRDAWACVYTVSRGPWGICANDTETLYYIWAPIAPVFVCSGGFAVLFDICKRLRWYSNDACFRP